MPLLPVQVNYYMPQLLKESEIYVVSCCEDAEQDPGARGHHPARCCTKQSCISFYQRGEENTRLWRPDAGWRGAAEVHGDLDDKTVQKDRCCRLLWPRLGSMPMSCLPVSR